jgi:rhomboid protease GluP
MAIGFSPKYIENIPLNNQSPEQLLVLAIEAAKQLGWDLGQKNETGFTAFTKFSMSSWSEEITLKVNNEALNIKSECTGNQIADWGKNKRNVALFIAKVEELKSTISIAELILKTEEFKQRLISEEKDTSTHTPSSNKTKITNFFSIFKPTEGYFITPILINLNILIFIIMALTGVNIIAPDTESLLKWGANFRPSTLEGEGWRLITNCFLHIGIFHLLMNMYALLYIGLLLEPYLGKSKFIFAYLLTGIAASVASLWWHDLTISAGASGAIFGLYGVFIALLTTNFIDGAARKSLLTSIGIFVGYNLINGMKGGIDNAAHIGGLISGLVIGYAFIPSLKRPEALNLKISTIALLTAFILATSYWVYTSLPNDIPTYETKIKEFTTNESLALEIYQLPENTPKEKLLYGIKDRGIYYWKENIALLDEIEKLNLPDQIHNRNQKLKRYCELRIKSYELIYKAIDEDTSIYKDQIEDYNKQIQSIITELGA